MRLLLTGLLLTSVLGSAQVHNPDVMGGEVLGPPFPTRLRGPSAPPSIGAWQVLEGSSLVRTDVYDVEGMARLLRLARERDLPRAVEVVRSSGASWNWGPARIDESGWIAGGTALAIGEVEAEEEGVWMVALRGAEALRVDCGLFAGRVGDGEWEGLPVLLPKGKSRIAVFGVRERFRFDLVQPESEVVAPSWAWQHDDLPRDSALWRGDIVVHVFDATAAGFPFLHFHYDDPVPAPADLPLWVDEWACGSPLSSLAATPLWVITWGMAWKGSTEAALLPMIAYGSGERGSLVRLARIPTAENPREAPMRGKDFPIELVYGTAGSEQETADLLAQARYDQQRLLLAGALAVDVRRDTEARASCEAARDPVQCVAVAPRIYLYGNADTNCALDALWPSDSATRATRGRLVVGEAIHEGEDLLGIFSLELKLGRYPPSRVTLFADTGKAGRELGFCLGLEGQELPHPHSGILRAP